MKKDKTHQKQTIYSLITLNKDGSFPNPLDKFFTIKQKQNLRIILDSKSLFSLKPYLLSNLPRPTISKKNKKAVRYPHSVTLEPKKTSFKEIEKIFTVHEGNFNLEGTWQCELAPEYSGSLFLQVIFVKVDSDIKEDFEIISCGRSEWIVVEPVVSLNNKILSYSQLNIQTVLPRLMGPLSTWKQVLKSQTDLGYNAFHFAPVQKLGKSQSLYSIKNQLKISKEIRINKNDVENEALLKETLHYLETNLNALSFIDILLNHTSSDSKWLVESRECYYSPVNTPALKSASILDLALQDFSTKVIKKELPEYTKGNLVETEEDVKTLLSLFEKNFLPDLRIPEYFNFKVLDIINQLKTYMVSNYGQVFIKDHEADIEEEPNTNIFAKDKDDILEEFLEKNMQNLGVELQGVTLNISEVAKNLSENPLKYTYELYKMILERMNEKQILKINIYLKEALENLKKQVIYEKVQCKRPLITEVDHLFAVYFTQLKNGDLAANNGWILDADPRENFATSENFHYLRRNIVIWEDLVKLRYGDTKADSKYLWKRMKKYVQSLAGMFNGFRIDNAHSTPLHVGEYFLRKAREINPNLHVFCELFCGSGDIDAKYVKILGANALVKEAHHCNELENVSGMLHYYGRFFEHAVGSLEPFTEIEWRTGDKLRELVPKVPAAILYDQTHDNVSYFEKERQLQCLPLIAQLAFSNCFIGTTRGYDELYQNRISVFPQNGKLYSPSSEIKVVKGLNDKYLQKILYYPQKKDFKNLELRGSWDKWNEGVRMKIINPKTNLHEAILCLPPGEYEYKFIVDNVWFCDPSKENNANGNNTLNMVKTSYNVYENLLYQRTLFNKYQKKLAEKYPEVYLEKRSDDVLTIMREHTSKSKFYMLISRNSFAKTQTGFVDVSVQLPGLFKKVKFIFYMKAEFEKQVDEKFLKGNKASIVEEYEIRKFCDFFYDPKEKKHTLHFTFLPPSSTILIKSVVSEDKKVALAKLNSLLFDPTQPKKWTPESLVKNLQASDINYLLFSCDPEEKEHNSQGPYHIPGKGVVSYAGLAGIYQDLRNASIKNDLGIPLFNNLRSGHWLLDYIINRIKKNDHLKEIQDYLSTVFELLKLIPTPNIPYYFTKIIFDIINIVEIKTLTNIKTPKIKLQTRFLQKLVLSTYQFIGKVPSAAVHPSLATMSAGLPHFAVGWARCWGRDTFTSYKGILLIPGHYDEAKEILLQFASTLRHGLLPNLLDKGIKPRFNCRDAVWWFLKALKDYIEFTKDEGIWKTQVELKFLDDNQEVHIKKVQAGEKRTLTIADIVQEIFEKHALGIKFREWGAGFELDWNMEYEGFNINLFMDEETGFIFGGNHKNCGTWMDKMGSSIKAGNKGVPSTPRDGAPIEMTALLYSALDFVIKANENKQFPYDSVPLTNNRKLTYKEWAEKIKTNFEKNYFIPTEKEKNACFNVLEGAVRRRGIYRDVIKCTKTRAEYQLRPNGCIAIAIAPELFSRKNAFLYLSWVEEMLIEENSIGVKTLDKIAAEYSPFYNNSDDSEVTRLAHGFSYHNGPEWVWIFGYFIKAFIAINGESKRFRLEQYMSYFTNHKKYIRDDEWLSLPELTNGNGEKCEFSCPAQAWSVASLLEAGFDAIKIWKSSQKE